MSYSKFRPLLKTTAIAAVTMCLAATAFAQDKSTIDPSSFSAAAFTTISGNPLTLRVGDNNSFQAFHAANPGSGQFYPNDSANTGAMGWIIQAGGSQFAPGLQAGSGIGTSVSYSNMVLSAVSGAGSTASPYQVTVDGTLGATGLSTHQVVSYVNGDNFYHMSMTLTNGGAAASDARIFLGGDIYLAGSDNGIPTRPGTADAVGGSDCGATPGYFILFIPHTPVTAWTGSSYSSTWSQIGAGALNNALATGCMDNGAALQWNRSIPAGGSVTLEASVSFGDIPPIIGGPNDPVEWSTVTVPASSNHSLLLMLLAVAGIGWLVLRRR